MQTVGDSLWYDTSRKELETFPFPSGESPEVMATRPGDRHKSLVHVV
ncbi:hypothetical protein AGR4A_pAt20024 [Agrobacterium tumefaciens str. B6]|uniref:Uncharacterized protein n=1 Tax=Agrobacterium tumefaciens str. B6 TaxID=1183423 RepID=A0A822VED6_AGRTU|nr:hypothetical protein AGR4A_pAt20024 [Agrobacterium tumefaciens str. B6]